MSETYNYPAEIECDEDGRYVVSFPDFGWGATDGATLEEALGEARDLLRELIATTMREGHGLPEPSRAGKLALGGSPSTHSSEGSAVRSVSGDRHVSTPLGPRP